MNAITKKILAGICVTVVSAAILTSAVFARDVALKLQDVGKTLNEHGARLEQQQELIKDRVTQKEFSEYRVYHDKNMEVILASLRADIAANKEFSKENNDLLKELVRQSMQRSKP